MNASNKQRTETLLRYLCLGAQIKGVLFGVGFVVLFDHFNNPAPVDYDDIYLNIDTRWAAFPHLPQALPDNEEDYPTQSLVEDVSALARLQGQQIIDVSLGNQRPHLILTFDSKSVLYINGYHEQYETWQLGVRSNDNPQLYLFVARPGGADIAIWTP